MFFYASKLLWLIVEPTNALVLLGVAACLFLRSRFVRPAVGVLVVAILGLAINSASPLGFMLTRPLASRFQRPGADMAAPDGIIVLGGAMDESVSEARAALVLNENGSRMTEAMILARRFPQARVIFTGGSGHLLTRGLSEADRARALFEALGFDGPRFIYEDQSRNTYENAIFTRDLIKPRADETFLLVTSAYHMPRSMGIFRKAGFNVRPWPANYLTHGDDFDMRHFEWHFAEGLNNVDRATREWIGLLAYRIAGYSDALFPAP